MTSPVLDFALGQLDALLILTKVGSLPPVGCVLFGL